MRRGNEGDAVSRNLPERCDAVDVEPREARIVQCGLSIHICRQTKAARFEPGRKRSDLQSKARKAIPNLKNGVCIQHESVVPNEGVPSECLRSPAQRSSRAVEEVVRCSRLASACV